jgi:hypothetical protein
MRAGAVPGMGFVTSFRGGSETRPAGHDAGLPGAGCPGGGRKSLSVGAAMKRGTGLSRSREAFGENRGRAPKGERAPKRNARRDERFRQASSACWRDRGIYPRVFRRSASPYVSGGSFPCRTKKLGRKNASREQENFASPLPACGESIGVLRTPFLVEERRCEASATRAKRGG